MIAFPKPIELERAFNQLKRGLMTGNHKVSLKAYSRIFDAGADAVPSIMSELEKFDLRKPLQVETTRLLSGLLSLHRDIDECGSDKFLARHSARDFPPVTAAVLRSAGRISNNDYRKTRYGNIQIWEQQALNEEYEASELVRAWLDEVPDADLAGIRRIYISPDLVEDDCAGTYLPGFAVITLAWWTILPASSWFNRVVNIDRRFTLFHEIGHHVHKHWFGQDPEQEKEANSYARDLVLKNSSQFGRVVRVSITLVKKIICAAR